VGKKLRELRERKDLERIETECCSDYIYMLVRIPPKYSISGVMGYLKGRSLLTIFDRYINSKYKYDSRYFWCHGYYINKIDKNARKDNGIDPELITRRPNSWPTDIKKIYWPVYRWVNKQR